MPGGLHAKLCHVPISSFILFYMSRRIYTDDVQWWVVSATLNDVIDVPSLKCQHIWAEPECWHFKRVTSYLKVERTNRASSVLSYDRILKFDSINVQYCKSLTSKFTMLIEIAIFGTNLVYGRPSLCQVWQVMQRLTTPAETWHRDKFKL